jgi:hypothetical protein
MIIVYYKLYLNIIKVYLKTSSSISINIIINGNSILYYWSNNNEIYKYFV